MRTCRIIPTSLTIIFSDPNTTHPLSVRSEFLDSFFARGPSLRGSSPFCGAGTAVKPGCSKKIGSSDDCQSLLRKTHVETGKEFKASAGNARRRPRFRFHRHEFPDEWSPTMNKLVSRQITQHILERRGGLRRSEDDDRYAGRGAHRFQLSNSWISTPRY